MSDAVSFAEIGAQRVELLPVRTVMSMFAGGFGGGGANFGGSGGFGQGGLGLDVLNINVLGTQSNFAGNGVGGAGGWAIGR
jgi:hypothetical protein